MLPAQLGAALRVRTVDVLTKVGTQHAAKMRPLSRVIAGWRFDAQMTTFCELSRIIFTAPEAVNTPISADILCGKMALV